MLVHSEEYDMKRNKFSLDPEQYSKYGMNNVMQLPQNFFLITFNYSTFFAK